MLSETDIAIISEHSKRVSTLMSVITRLNKEADCLARQLMAMADMYGHPCPRDNCQYKENSPDNIDIDSICCACWRDIARTEVEDDE